MEAKMIGSKIAEARKKMNLSQARLAQNLFISPQAVGKWERGESFPDILAFNRLAKTLGVDLNYFSDDFQSVVDDNISVEPLVVDNADLSREMRNEKMNWNMSGGNWVDADFSGLKNLHGKFSSSNMQRCKFNGSELSGLLLKSNNVEACDFSDSSISSSRIQGSNLSKNNFRNCVLKEADFAESNIEKCDFSNVDFNGTKFTNSYICGCDFSGANLTGVVIKSGGFTGGKSTEIKANILQDAVWNRTTFIDTQISDLVFTGAMDDCYFENCKFTRVKFQQVKLLNTFFKNNRNLRRMEFTDCKADRMTYEFLKQGKADLSGITFTEALLDDRF